jgi:hypothetical protein
MNMDVVIADDGGATSLFLMKDGEKYDLAKRP